MNQEQIQQEIDKLQQEKQKLISDKAVLENDIKKLSETLGVKEGDDIDKLIQETQDKINIEAQKLETLIEEYNQANGQ